MPPDSRRLTLCAGRASPAPWLSHRESWHGAAVTERVPRRNQRTNVQTCDCKRPLRLAFRSPAPPEGEPRAAAPPNLVHHPPSNRVTPSGVGLLPGSQSRHCPRVLTRPLSLASLASSPIGGAKGGCAAEFHLQMFDIALSAQCADVVSP